MEEKLLVERDVKWQNVLCDLNWAGQQFYSNRRCRTDMCCLADLAGGLVLSFDMGMC